MTIHDCHDFHAFSALRRSDLKRQTVTLLRFGSARLRDIRPSASAHGYEPAAFKADLEKLLKAEGHMGRENV